MAPCRCRRFYGPVMLPSPVTVKIIREIPVYARVQRRMRQQEEATMQAPKQPSFLNRRGARFRSAAICSTALVLFMFAGAPAFAGEIDDLKAQVQQLMKRIKVLQAEQAETSKKAEEARTAALQELRETRLFTLRTTLRSVFNLDPF